jgi:hypothetical protein
MLLIRQPKLQPKRMLPRTRLTPNKERCLTRLLLRLKPMLKLTNSSNFSSKLKSQLTQRAKTQQVAHSAPQLWLLSILTICPKRNQRSSLRLKD